MRHEILGRLAVGGMAELYTARAIRPDGSTEHVVLKRILPHLSMDPDFVRMFHDEAHLARALRHPNIVRVHEIGQHEGEFFFTMEYVHGDNTRTMIRAAQEAEVHIPLQHVVQIGLGVTTGLHYAHEKVDEAGNPLRIVHRDVSPTNILVSFRGDVKIVDFGIAKAAAATHITQAGMLKGKASYMSPEQCRADPVDRRSDVYAIGILLYEMTTLSRLFRGDNELAILHQILTGRYDLPSLRVPGYPADLERIIVRCLQQQPGDRYQTALEIRDDLARFAEGHGLRPSAEALGLYLLDLCGDKPYPWAEDAGDIELDSAGESATSPTTTGVFDEQDTKVNRPTETKTPPPGPPGRDEEPQALAPAEPPTDPIPIGGAPPRPVATARAAASPSPPARPRIAPAPRPPAGGAASGAERSSTDRHRPVGARSPGSSRIKPAPRPGGAASSPTGATRPMGASADAEAKAALASMPEAPPLRRPTGRGPGRQALPGPLTARQSSAVAPPGRTLPGVMPAKGTTLAGTPSPPQSRRTLPGADATVVPDAAGSPAPASLVASMRAVGPGGAAPTSSVARTVVPGAVSAVGALGPARTVVPGASTAATASASVAATSPIPASSVETAAVPRVREAVAPPADEPGVDRTMLIPSPEHAPTPGTSDPRPTMLARTMHLDAGVGAAPLPTGPTGWATDRSGAPSSSEASATGFLTPPPSASASHEASAPFAASSQPDLPAQPRAEPSQPNLMATQRSQPSQPNLLVTQRSNPSQPNLMVTQRSGAAAKSVTQRHPSTGPGAQLPDLQPDPARRRGTPLWVPMLIVLVVAGLAASAVWWLWGRGHLAKTSDDAADAGAGAGAGDGAAQGPAGPGDAAADPDAGAGVGVAEAEADAEAEAEAADTGEADAARAGDDTVGTADETDAKADGGDAKADGGDAKADGGDAKADGGDAKADDAGDAKAEDADDDGGDDAKGDDGGDAKTDGGGPPEPGTKPRTKSTKKPKKKPSGETPEPKPQIPGFWPGPVPP